MIYIIFFIGILIGLGTGLLAGYSYAANLIQDLSEDTAPYQCSVCRNTELPAPNLKTA
ncbi:MAG: hypothetical protein JWO78_143 [Micavibrio sp.]|nr:hypothetical protein [Micavibrio sp.]